MRLLYNPDTKEVMYISQNIIKVDNFNYDVELYGELSRVSGQYEMGVVTEYPEVGIVVAKYLFNDGLIISNPEYMPPVNVDRELFDLRKKAETQQYVITSQQETIDELTLLVAELLMGGE